MLRHQFVTCRHCFNGNLYIPCQNCEGTGHPQPGQVSLVRDMCDVCNGEGEVIVGKCTTCNATGYISRALAILLERVAFIKMVDPEWDGTPKDGSTDYDEAMYYRNRDTLREKCVSIRAYHHAEFDALVELKDAQGNVLIAFSGLAWGYGGTGPSGFATIVADVWPDKYVNGPDEVLNIICRKGMQDSFTLEKIS